MKLKEAANQFREAIRQEPNNAKAHQRLGAVLAAMNDYETAILECKQATKLDAKISCRT
jgi:Tetratricopeptide repeat.